MAERVYQNENIAVYWDSTRCIHTALCLMNLPEVFDVDRRPWVDINAAPADAIADAVETCPTGALRFRRLDDAPGETAPDETEVMVWPNGPLLLRGKMKVTLPDGTVLAEENRLALCRCGGSRNQPFCDNTHRYIRFRNNPKAVPASRQDADSPQEAAPEAGLP